MPDIDVYLYKYDPGWGDTFYVASAYTTSDGTYDVGGLNTGTYRVGFFKCNNDYISEYYYLNAPDLESATNIEVTVGETTSGIDASLSQGGHLRPYFCAHWTHFYFWIAILLGLMGQEVNFDKQSSNALA